MARSNQNILDFKGVHSATKMATKEANSQFIPKGRQVLSTRFSEILKGFFEKIDDELFALSDKAENSSLQTSYFDAMRYVRKERSSMQNNYLGAIERGYDTFWEGKLTQVAESNQSEESEFSLVDEEELEESLAITTMVDKGENRYHGELYALNKRFSVLLNIDKVDKCQNPVAPAQLCQMFRSTLSPLDLNLDIKLVVYKLFDRLVLSNMGIIYAELNALLIGEGVLPKIQKKVRKEASGPNSKSLKSAEEVVEEKLSPEQFELFSSLQNLVGAYREGSDSGYSLGAGSGPVYEINEVIDVLNLAQNNITNSHSGSLLRGDELKVYLANTLGEQQPGGNKRPFASMEEDVIDMVGMVFDYILEDKNLPSSVKALLGRLQIPMLKVAIMDKGFFAKKEHPARELLNRLSKAGVELSNDDCDSRNPAYIEIESIVEQILNGFDNNNELFESLLGEFSDFLDKDQKRSQVLEGRTLQVSESKEKLLLAKKQAVYEVAKQLQGKRVPSVVKDFIEGIWKDVVVLAALRVEREPEGLERSVSMIGRLVESVIPPESVDAKQKILREIPLLIKELRIGLENISVDSHEMASFFKDLEQCHVACLKGTHEAQEKMVEEAVLLPSKSEEEIEEACDVLLEELISSDSTGQDSANNLLSDKGDFDSEEIVLSSDSVSREEVLDDDFVDKAKALDVGQWFDVDRDEKVVRLKLSWKSQVTSVSVFVDRKGAKVLELSQQGLAAELRRGAIRIVNETKMPLMERALAAMMTTLKAGPKDQEIVTP